VSEDRPDVASEDAVPTRDWCATAFVVWRGRLLLHHHAKLGRWLPPGGHVERDELPDDAAVREVHEETGVHVELIGERAHDAPGPVQLLRPRGVQLETIRPGHEHIDLIYFARPVEPYDGTLPLADDDPSLGWYDAEALQALELDEEMRAWCALALREGGGSAG
jgi:8-oxo-dGTP pyrophosphatase MutT (NUDIX family)